MTDSVIVETVISVEELKILAQKRFGDMVKGVIDIKTGIVALGAELHADEEADLLEIGSEQENLWGFNIYVDEKFPENVEFDSMINIRPRQNNMSRYIEDEKIRERIIIVLRRVIKND